MNKTLDTSIDTALRQNLSSSKTAIIERFSVLTRTP